jgi:hypothetical protein
LLNQAAPDTTFQAFATYKTPQPTPDCFPLTVVGDELQHVIDAWGGLPHAIRAGIIAMTKAAAGDGRAKERL